MIRILSFLAANMFKFLPGFLFFPLALGKMNKKIVKKKKRKNTQS